LGRHPASAERQLGSSGATGARSVAVDVKPDTAD
jgi:hypothetical protein